MKVLFALMLLAFGIASSLGDAQEVLAANQSAAAAQSTTAVLAG
jgi:hypothetical protein